ncbi:putative cellulase [Medicago truncatula]|uniref:cellulase n=1 Tax=Medicago truncatula TaxID=3880 RepID=A0A396HDJ6_MEDTR|nr:putative cellulase [Medicago truncatula]
MCTFAILFCRKILKNTILIALKICRDELLWGAAWLHKATKNLMYLNYIKVNGQIHGADVTDNTFGWDNKHAGARILLSKGHADNFICSAIPGDSLFLPIYTRWAFCCEFVEKNTPIKNLMRGAN